MNYKEFKEQLQKQINEFPIFFAFSNEQFKAGCDKWGIVDPKAELTATVSGGVIRIADSDRYNTLFTNQDKLLMSLLKNPEFFYEAFLYELGNHEYCYTYDETDTWESIGLGDELERAELMKIPGIKEAYVKAKTIYAVMSEGY